VHKKRAGRCTLLDALPGLHHLPVMASFKKLIPEGDNRERSVCTECGYVAYENPKVVVGSVIGAGDSILMCRRAIEPRLGFWTMPAGYLELGETLQEGAAREALEEADASIAIDGILGVFSIARIGQVQVIFRARFADSDGPAFAPGPESQEVRLFAWDDIPWDDIAFPSVHWALHAWRDAGSAALGRPAGNPPHDVRGVHRLPPPTTEQPGEAIP
jgi:ADP-ribose pyrophosphatase YjhB (NUDIX family)